MGTLVLSPSAPLHQLARPPPLEITTLAVFAPGPPRPPYCRQTLYHNMDAFEIHPGIPNYRDVWANSDYRSFSAALQPALQALDRSITQYAQGEVACQLCGISHHASDFAGRTHLGNLWSLHCVRVPLCLFPPEASPWINEEVEWCCIRAHAPDTFLDFNMMSGQIFVLGPPPPVNDAGLPLPPPAPLLQQAPWQRRGGRDDAPPPPPSPAPPWPATHFTFGPTTPAPRTLCALPAPANAGAWESPP